MDTARVLYRSDPDARLIDRVARQPYAGQRQYRIPGIGLAAVDVARVKVGERFSVRGPAHGAPPLIGRESAIVLVGRVVQLPHHIVERAAVVRGIADENFRPESSQRTLLVKDGSPGTPRIGPCSASCLLPSGDA